jgi:hypothetical protein
MNQRPQELQLVALLGRAGAGAFFHEDVGDGRRRDRGCRPWRRRPVVLLSTVRRVCHVANVTG